MKIITLSKIGYNAPSGANWSYGIWKLDLINTDQSYAMSFTLKENFGGDSRFRESVMLQHKVNVIETKSVYTSTGTPNITGVRKLLDLEGKETMELVAKFLV